jgi:MFS family permease
MTTGEDSPLLRGGRSVNIASTSSLDEALDRHRAQVKKEEQRVANAAQDAADTDGGIMAIPWRTLSRNVPRTIFYNLADGASFSLWQATVFQQMLYRLGGDSNASVGYIAGLTGAAQMLAAVFGSILADRTKKQNVCRLGALFGLVGAVTSAVGTQQQTIAIFYGAAVCWGCYMGASNPASEALFGDSVVKGRRTAVYSFKWMVQILSYLVGYTTIVVLFWRLGNTWAIETMQTVMYCGLGLHTVAFAALCSLNDSAALPKQKDPELADRIGSTETFHSSTTLQSLSLSNDEGSFLKETAGTIPPRLVPYFTVCSDVIVAIGSGMTLRFIPLYFINARGLSPMVMAGVAICSTLLMTVVAAGANAVVSKLIYNRVVVVMLARILGTLGLYYLAFAEGVFLDIAPMCVVFVGRMAMMNSCIGVSRSIMMDHVPEASRARWSAMESFSGFTWAGSAVLGGYIADTAGYRDTFKYTAMIHTVAICCMIPAALAIRDRAVRQHKLAFDTVVEEPQLISSHVL